MIEKEKFERHLRGEYYGAAEPPVRCGRGSSAYFGI